MDNPRIILSPKNISDQLADVLAIENVLSNIALLGENFADKQFYAGEAFINLLSFLGCSPNINLSPVDGDNFCYIEINSIAGEARILGHTNSVIPRCPDCKHKLKDWQSINNYQYASTSINCPECNALLKMPDLKWRQEGGYGRFYIAITNIHPHEAVPSEKLIQTLEQTTGFKWHYFYANNSTWIQ